MVKKAIALLILCVSLSFTATAKEDEPEYLQEYDNYYEFEQDYNDSVVVDKINKQKNPLKANVPALLIGGAAGAGTVYLFLRNRLSTPQPDPYFRKPAANHETIKEKDILKGK